MFTRWLKRIIWLLLILAAGYAAFVFFSPQQQAAPVTVRMEGANVQRSLLLRGRLQPLVQTEVLAQISGHIVGEVPALGQQVRQGDTLLQMEAGGDFVAKVKEATSLYTEADRELKQAGRIAVSASARGKVANVLAKVGSSVKTGQVLANIQQQTGGQSGGALIPVKAPRDGKVQSILAGAGDVVAPSDALPMFYLAPSKVQMNSYDWRGAGELLRRFWQVSMNLELLELMANRKYRGGKLPLNQVFVKSPVEGMLNWRADGLLPGALIVDKQPLFKLSSSERIMACKVHEVDYFQVTPGQRTLVSFDAFPNAKVKAHLLQKDLTPQKSVFDQYSEYVVRFTLEEAPPQLVDGMSANLRITLREQMDLPSLPLAAVIFEKGSASVVVWENNRPVRVPVKLGMQGEARAEILSGLQPESRVVLHPQSLPNMPSLTSQAAAHGAPAKAK